MINKIYYDTLNVDNFEKILNKFHDNIVDTNRGHNFFVDWEKIKEHVKRHTIEFNILNTLIGSEDFDNDLKEILSKYPEVLPSIPILIAVRDRQLKVITDFLDAESDLIQYDFSERELSDREINKFINFFHQTGLKYFFENLSTKSIQDYVTGVEVGMDTHARKNRSGKAMELVLKPIIEEINSENNFPFKILFQKYFKELKKYNFKVESSIANRKADFIIIGNNKVINIEVNFYRGTGSKPQEIVDSYINRQNELNNHGFDFIWVTDGHGWQGQKNQIRKAFNKINYLLNLHFVRKSMLEKILLELI